MYKIKLFIVSILLSLLCSCSSLPGHNEIVFGGAGATAGGLLANQYLHGTENVVLTTAGAIAGYGLGRILGEGLDDTKKLMENSKIIN